MTNRELILKFYEEVFNGKDLSHLDDYMLDSYHQHNPDAQDGKQGFLRFAEHFLALDPHMDIVKIVCEDDIAVVFFKCTIRSNGTVNKVFDMYRIENGKLAEHWDCVMHDIDDTNTASGNSQF
ncbi:MAG: nuclear transport factor 2 family protein [Lachnospiraceae bacterium]|nr:nuclear transport factor 2 family protein [Lachnospiraceae bacterium]